MGLNTRKKTKDTISVPMSAMIDVVFLLLIYFIVTYKEEIPEAHLAVNLPQPNEPPPVDIEPPPLLEIEVHPGEFLLRGRAMSPSRMQSVLRNMAAQSEDLTVVIKVNQRAKTRNLVTVLDICQEVNLTNLNVVALQ
jgi:biopolymer transport protein ExbD